jgi:bis(5'-nucleosidyl)-tetraphosphatase
MGLERSFGVVPISKTGGKTLLFIVQHYAGHWVFPRGHAEGVETPLQTAERELEEETGLKVIRWIERSPFIEHYTFQRSSHRIEKEIQYFPAIVLGKISLQKHEVKSGLWVYPEEVFSYAVFPEMKKLAQEVSDWIQKVEI